jgi:predicted metalloprotease
VGRRGRVAVAVVGLLAVLATACGGSSTGGDDPDATTGRTADDEPVDLGEPVTPLGRVGAGEDVIDVDEVMLAAGLDAEAFWEEQFPLVYGAPMEPLQGGYWTYGPDTPDADLPPCADGLSYADLEANALYCSFPDLIAWDAPAMVVPLVETYGAFTAAVVAAHEWGHAVQARTGVFESEPSIIKELQADCFAGAWVGHVADGGSEWFEASLDELDLAVAGLISLRDAPGADAGHADAHGSGFDRVSAFGDGLSQGAERCAAYPDEPPLIVQVGFRDEAEASAGGDLTPDELVPLLVADLEDFWTIVFAELGLVWEPVADVVGYDPDAGDVTCGDEVFGPDQSRWSAFYCVPDNTVRIDTAYLAPALWEIGDFAVGASLARQWAHAAQARSGLVGNTTDTLLHADCLAGIYAGSALVGNRPDGYLSLSPGDLDEAIISFLAFGGASSTEGSPFERTEAFRLGLLDGVHACDARYVG